MEIKNTETKNIGINTQLRMVVYSSLFAALTAAGAYLALPIGPVPIVLQNFFIMLTGLLLERNWAVASVALYLFAGTFGLPVFAAGSGGIGHIAGPTGGYLLGYLPAVYVIAVISEKGGRRAIFDVIAMICGSIIVYLCGIIWLKTVTGMTMSKSLAVGMFPFLIGDSLKIVAAVSVVKSLRKIIKL